MPQTVEYIDWSDRGQELYESGKGGKFADMDFDIDEYDNLSFYLRRNTSKRRDFTLILENYQAKYLYEKLKEVFGDG